MMYAQLRQFNQRPLPYSRMTVETLWQDPHLAGQMLQFHLNESVEAASRPKPFRDAALAWIKTKFAINQGSKMLDLGCGPGLFAEGFARLGADVTAVDFSKNSIDYAINQAKLQNLDIHYSTQDYLQLNLDGQFDLITLIFCDLCPLSPTQRQTLLCIVKKHLKAGGRLIFDVFSTKFFEQSEEVAAYEINPAGGFWSAADAFVFHNRFLYKEESLYLDQYHIIENNKNWEIFNWLQCFTPDSLEVELKKAGLKVESLRGDLTGADYNPDNPQFAITVMME